MSESLNSPSAELPTEIEDRVIAALECVDDGERVASIDALCRAHEDYAGAIRGLVDAASARSVATGQTLVQAFRAASGGNGEVGITLGAYRIVEQLGQGAHGDVYLAEQDQPVRRRVALKLLRSRDNRDEILARFDAERQALALLDHAAIAKILDAGAAEDGRPWFALELVPSARSITRFCAEERIDLRGRLALFATVCDAVQHAHGRGILHRDLKPGNVLCANVDGRPAPKVIDFGIAKATGGRLTDLAFRTIAGSPLGTPIYASPEQARGALDVDVRSDVYSLGGLLHELCCGEYPFAEHELARTWTEDRAKFFEVVTGLDPEPPSKRLAAGTEPVAWGESRAALTQTCRGDIDAIVGKALARSREQRYQTVSELGADVRRVLAGEPVAARIPGVIARAARAARRNRVAVAMSLLAVITLGVALGFAIHSNSELSRAESDLATRNADLHSAVKDLETEQNRLSVANAELDRLRRIATDEGRVARDRADTLEVITERLRLEVREAQSVRSVLRHVTASLADGPVTLERWIDRLVQPLDGSGQVWTTGVESSLRRTAAWIAIGLGRKELAREQLEGALALLEGDDRATQLEYAATAHELAESIIGELDDRQARELLSEAVQIFREQLGPDAPETLAAVGDLAFLELHADNPLLKIAALNKVVDIGRRLLLEDGAELSARETRKRFEGILADMRERVLANDEAAARRSLDQILVPVLESPLLRRRLCESLWAMALYEQCRDIAPMLLEAAVDYGTQEHGPGHDDVMRARSTLLVFSVNRMRRKPKPPIAAFARSAAHAMQQIRLEATVPWGKEELPLRGARALGIVILRAEEAGVLPDAREDFIRIAEETGWLTPEDLTKLSERLDA